MVPNEYDLLTTFKEIFDVQGVEATLEVDVLEEFQQAIVRATLEKDKEHVGNIQLQTQADKLVWHTLELVPEFQGNGYYTHLADAIPKWCRDHGLSEIVAHAVENTDGRALFLRSGFKPVDSTQVVTKIGPKTSGLEKYAAKKQG